MIVPWTNHIEDPVVRRETRELLSAMPFINAGFAAGTVRALMGYPARRRPPAEDGPQRRAALGRPGRDGAVSSP